MGWFDVPVRNARVDFTEMAKEKIVFVLNKQLREKAKCIETTEIGEEGDMENACVCTMHMLYFIIR